MKIVLKKINTLSNYISFFRILLAVPIFIFISNINEIPGARTILLSLFFLVYLTDIADGYFARKFNQVTELGKIIDPFADKALVFLVVTYLYYFELIPALYYWIIIGRDILIFGGGIIVSRKIGKVLPSNYLGKITVLSIGIFIIIVTLGVGINNVFYEIFYWGSLILSVLSIISYGITGYKAMKKANNEII